MKSILTLFLVSFFAQISFGHNYVQDQVNNTFFQVQDQETTVDCPLYGQEQVEFYYGTIKPNKYKGIPKINEQVELLSHDFLRSEEVYEEFMLHFNASVEYEFSTQDYSELLGSSRSDQASKFKPELDDVRFYFTHLNHEVAILQCEIDYDVMDKKNQRKWFQLKFSKLYYFDLNTGSLLSPSEFIDHKKLKEFNQLIQDKVPEKFKELVTKEVLDNANYLFNGANFYAILLENSNDFEYGLPNLHIRFSLREIQPFLSNTGGLREYKNLVEKAPTFQGFCYLPLAESNRFHEAEYEYMLYAFDFAFRVQKAPKTDKIIVWYNSPFGKRQKSVEMRYRKDGEITSIVRYERGMNFSKAIDSLQFEYDDGHLSSVYVFETSNYVPYLVLGESWQYNEKGTIISRKAYVESYDGESIQYYALELYLTYFNGYAIMDGNYHTIKGMHNSRRSLRYSLFENYMLETGESDQIPNQYHYEIEQTSDSLKIDWTLREHTFRPRYAMSSGKVISGHNDRKKRKYIEVEYNATGQATFYQEFRKEDGEKVISKTVMAEYDSEGLPKTLSMSNSGVEIVGYDEVYEFEYFKR
ncbi:MAG: hypothetical protein GQ574_10210 [Crocinitomix sp.]|nr:hypothetical protein [Crocinitomix sp.]